MLGWDGGREDRGYVLLGFDGNSSSITTDIVVDATLNLGSAVGTQTLANRAFVTATLTVLAAVGTYAAAVAVVVPGTSAAATALATALTNYASSLASYTTLKAKGA